MTKFPTSRSATVSPARWLALCGLLFHAAGSSAGLGPDFDGDGKADVFWHNGRTGDAAVWFMNGVALKGGAGLMPPGSNWVETHFADFDGDGKTDIVWRNTVTGESALWLMNGGAIKGGAGLLADPNWEVTHTGDFNGDGKADIVWRHTNGSTALWLMDGLSLLAGAGLVADPNWRITHVADIDGDGKADILWRNQSTGETVVWYMNGATLKGGATIVTNTQMYLMHVADFNGDGKKDLMFRNAATGETSIRLLNNGALISNTVILTDPNWIPTHVADFNGDGKADILWRNSTTGETAMWLMNGAAFAAGGIVMSDPAWRVTHVADFNGDGKADLLWYNDDTGATAVWQMSGQSIMAASGLLSDRSWHTTLVNDTSNPLGYLASFAERDAMRFLAQSTMGADDGQYTNLRGMSLDLWLYQQFITPATPHTPYLNSLLTTTRPLALVDDFMESWWYQALAGTDQFRQRAAYALSQLVVISANDPNLNNQPSAFAAYQDILVNNVYGNYRQLLKDVSLSPAMGMYLNLLGSQKGNYTTTFPNENYARELLQLFSIGLFQLNSDGTYRRDAGGQLIPTYDQNVIQGYAAALSGWAWGGAPAGTSSPLGPCPAQQDVNQNAQFTTSPTNLGTRPECYYPFPMLGWQSRHETGSLWPRTILAAPWVQNDTFVTQANIPTVAGPTQIQQDLDAVIDSIFNHPNLGPYVCKAMIQRLVTSNPSPGYVSRCVAAFAPQYPAAQPAYGRGDMKQLWRAILLDPEARTPSNQRDTQYGKSKEPLLRFNSMIRALNGKSTSLRYRFSDFSNPESALGQSPYRSPTVFNFYDPDYVPDGGFQASSQVAPEFQILTTTSAVGINNFLYSLIVNGQNGVGGATADRVNLDYSTLVPLATKPSALIDRLNFVLLGGKLSLPLRQQIQKAIEALPSTTAQNQTDRVKMAVYLMTLGPEFTTQK
jgi:uncharacterized protein (DUF1800 family)